MSCDMRNWSRKTGGGGIRTRVQSRVLRNLYERSPGLDLIATLPWNTVYRDQPRCKSHPAQRRHRAARSLGINVGPGPRDREAERRQVKDLSFSTTAYAAIGSALSALVFFPVLRARG